MQVHIGRHARSIVRRRFRLHPVGLAVCLLAGGPALALPDGGTVVQGQATIAPVAPGRLDIRQASDRAAIDWRSFSIGSGESVRIVQPNASSVLLNRVVGVDPSVLLGSLQANGRVFLSNPRGIVFGAGSQVDTGGLLATTLDIARDPLDGRYVLNAGSQAPGAIVSQGRISAPGGTVVLAAPQVTHSGFIDAARVGLAAVSAVTVDVEGDGLVLFNARNDGLDTRLAVLGEVRADGGSAELRAAARAGFADTVLNLEGIVRARTLGERQGQVVIDGGGEGITRVGGQVDVSGARAGERGGQVRVEGRRVLLDGTAQVDASGDAGGGQVRIGGDYQGRNPDMRNAEMLLVREGARISADASMAGDGGRVILWSDASTRYAGQISARGGAHGGNGGFVEVSGARALDFRGTVDLSAPQDAAGTLLLDPLNLTIEAAAPDIDGNGTTGDDLSASSLPFGDHAGANSVITAAAVETQLATASVVLQATNDITVDAAINHTGSSTLTLQAGNDIHVNADVTVDGGLSLLANDNGGGSASGSGRVSQAAGTTLTVGPSSMLEIRGAGIHQLAGTINAGTLRLSGDSRLDGQVSAVGATVIESGTLATTRSQQLSDTGSLAVNAGGTLQLAPASWELIGSLSGAGSVIGAGSELATEPAVNSTFSGGISGISQFAKWGRGTLTLTGTSNVGNVDVNVGGLSVAGGSANLTAQSLQVLVGATLDVSQGANVHADVAMVDGGTISTSQGVGHINGSVSQVILVPAAPFRLRAEQGANLRLNGTVDFLLPILKEGPGTVTFAGPSTLDSVHVAAGTLQLQADSQALGSFVLGSAAALDLIDGARLATGRLDVEGGAVVNSSGSGTLNSPVQLQGDLILDVQGSGLTLAGNITESGGSYSLTKSGPGMATLSGVSSYTGATHVEEGTLVTSKSERLPDLGGVTVAQGATLQLNGIETIGSLEGAGNVNVAGSELRTGANGASTTFSGVISGAGDLITQGGTLTLTGANTHTGTTDIGGTLSVRGSGARVSAGPVQVRGPFDVSDGAVVDNAVILFDGGTLGTSSGTGRIDGTLRWSGGRGGIVRFLAADGTELRLNERAQLDGAMAIKEGPGTVTFAGGGTFGSLGVNAGTLQFLASSYSALEVEVRSGATLDLSDNAQLNAALLTNLGGTVANSSGAGTLNSPVQLEGDLRLEVQGSGLTLAGDITESLGSFGIAKTGAGPATLLGVLSYSGTTRIDGGTLSTTGAEQLPDGGAVEVAAGATLQLGGDETIGSLSGSGSVTLGPGSLTTGGNGASTTFNGAIAGSGGLVKEGAGMFTMAASSAYGGATRVNAGTLATSGAERLPDVGAVTVAQGATLQLGGNETIGSLGGSGWLRIGGGWLRMGRDGSNTTYAGTIHGAGALVKEGLGTFTLARRANHTGGTLVEAGTFAVVGSVLPPNGEVAVSAGATLEVLPNTVEDIGGLSGAGRVVVGAGSSLRATLQQDATFAGTISGPGAFEKDGTASLTLSGASDVSEVFLVGGSLDLSGPGARLDAPYLSLGQASTLDVSGGAIVNVGLIDAFGGTLATSLGTGQVNGRIEAASNAPQLNLHVGAGARLQLSGPIDLLDKPLIKDGPGTATLGGGGAFGAMHVADGSLQLQGPDAWSASGLNLQVGTTLDLSGGAWLTAALLTNFGGTLANSSGFGTLSGPVQLQGNLRLDVQGSGLTLAGGITESGGSHGITKTGAGQATLQGVLAYSGTTRIDGGTLSTIGAEQLPDGSAVEVAAGAALQLGGSETIGSLAGAGVVNLGTGTLTTGGNNASTTFSGTLDGGGLVKQGSGTFTLAAASAFGGATTVRAGTLATTGAEQLPDTTEVSVFAGATLALGGSETVDSLTSAGTVTGGPLIARSIELHGGSIGDFSTGHLTTRGDITIAGTPTLASLDVAAGTLTLSAAERLPDDAAVSIDSGASLVLGGNETIGSLAGAGVVNLGTGTLVTGGNNASTTFSGTLDGGSGLVKQGSGTFTLAAASAFGGAMVIRAGTLATTGAEQLPDTSDLSVFAGATLALGGNETLGSLAGAGSVNIGTGALAVGGNHASTTFSGAIDGSGSLIKQGSGTFTLSGANTYAGGTTISAGTLHTTGAERLPDSGDVAVAAAAGLVLGGAETVGALDADGFVVLNGSLAAERDLLLRGPVRVDAGGQPLMLGARHLEATSTGNDWGLQPLSIAAVSVRLSSGLDASGSPHDLNLGTVTLEQGGHIDAARIHIGEALVLNGGDLTLTAHAQPTYALFAPPTRITATGPWLAIASDAVSQADGSRITTAAGSTLSVHAPRGGSIGLTQDGNDFGGALNVLSGAHWRSPWAVNLQTIDGQPAAGQAMVSLAGRHIRVGAPGIESDLVRLRADRVDMASPDSRIVARLAFDTALGAQRSAPALVFELTDVAWTTPGSFGAPGEGALRVEVGGPNGGGLVQAVRALPWGTAGGEPVVHLAGPATGAGYQFAVRDAGAFGSVPVFYNEVAWIPSDGLFDSLMSLLASMQQEPADETVSPDDARMPAQEGLLGPVLCTKPRALRCDED